MRHFIMALVVIPLLWSCVEQLEDDPIDKDHAPIVVKCVLTSGERQTLKLYYATTENGNPFPLDEADVKATLRLADSSLVQVFRKVAPGEWEAYYKPKNDTEYMLTVSVPGRPTIVARTTTTREVEVRMEGIVGWELSGLFVPMEQKLVISGLGGHYLEENGSGIMTNYIVRGSQKDCYLWICNDFGSSLGTNHLYVDKFNMSGVKKFDSEKYPMINSYGPITVNSNSWLEGRSLHDGPLRIVHKCDENVNGFPSPIWSDQVNYITSGLLPPNNWTPALELMIRNEYCKHLFNIYGDFNYKKEPGYLKIYQVSESLDRYYKSVERYMMNSQSDLLDLLYSDMDVIYTNVSNGYGIFGAASLVKIDISSLAIEYVKGLE